MTSYSLSELHSAEFHDKFTYFGPLGSLYAPESTTFRLWAPTASNVWLVDETSGTETPMERGERGTWEIVRDGDQRGFIYRYKVRVDGVERLSPDPYGRASTPNSVASVVVDSAAIVPENWKSRMEPFSSPSDAVIYEAHIRDLTIGTDNGITHKGKFVGLTETGTTTSAGNPSGLDYITSLGVTHVQFLPMYDFGSINELGDLSYNAQYNWGYDPVNYNVPEGSYATDPTDPEARIREMKAMIQAFHDRGLRVIMDVVYNHVYDASTHAFELTVPGYFFRMTPSGEFFDGTDCGNETASEQPMMRKYIVDSVSYWAREYNLDGFRFDLMGIHDVETMNAVRAALDEIDPSIIVIGEGWEMGNHPDGVVPANYTHADEMPRIGHFNDSLRDGLKGSVFTQAEAGFVSGLRSDTVANRVLDGLRGSPGAFPFLSPAQSVVYNEAHDNFTLVDKLAGTAGLELAGESELTRRALMALTIQAMSQGVLFIHAGQEFFRTKGGDENSFRSPDSVNVFDYDRAARFAAAVEYFRQIIALRRATSWFRRTTFEEIAWSELGRVVRADRIEFSFPDDAVFGFINASNMKWPAQIRAGRYEVLVADARVGGEEIVELGEGEALNVAQLSVTLVRAVAELSPPPRSRR